MEAVDEHEFLSQVAEVHVCQDGSPADGLLAARLQGVMGVSRGLELIVKGLGLIVKGLELIVKGLGLMSDVWSYGETFVFIAC